MRVLFTTVLFVLISITGIPQTSKVAILDFENTSGNAEFDAFGKAMSSMLITDLSNNIHPKKVDFFERSQLNKLLDEQQLQKSKNFDAKTAVDFGKFSGVDFVLVGSVFVMDGNCNITSSLVDVETSKIVLSEEANGEIVAWLQLKSQLAESIATQLNHPITLDPRVKDNAVSSITIKQYGKVLTTLDEGNLDKAEQMSSLFDETTPDFTYFAELRGEIEQLKEEVKEIKRTLEDALEPEKIAVDLINQNREITDAIEYLDIFDSRINYANEYGDTKKLFVCYQKAKAYYRLGDFKKSMAYYDSTLSIEPNFFIAHWNKMSLMMGDEFAHLPPNVLPLKPDRDYTDEIEDSFVAFTSYGKKNAPSFNPRIHRRSMLTREECDFSLENSDCDFFSSRIQLPTREARTIFDLLLADIDVWDMHRHIILPSNLYARYLISVGQKEKARLILENSLFQLFEYLDGTESYYTSEVYVRKKDRTFNLVELGRFRDYDNLVSKFGPIFMEHEPGMFISGSYNHEPENNGFTDNIILLSNLLILEQRYSDAVNLLLAFRSIFGQHSDSWNDNQSNYKVDNFKVSLNLLLLSRIAGMESRNLREECRQIYNQENFHIRRLYNAQNLSFEQFLNERSAFLEEFFLPEEIMIGLADVFSRTHEQAEIDYADQKEYFLPPTESKEELSQEDGNFHFANLFFEELTDDIGVYFDRSKFVAVKTYAFDDPSNMTWDQPLSRRPFYLLVDKERFSGLLEVLNTLNRDTKINAVFTARHRTLTHYSDDNKWEEHFLIGEVSYLEQDWVDFYQSGFLYNRLYSVSNNGQLQRKIEDTGEYCVYAYHTSTNSNVDVFVLDYNKGMYEEHVGLGTLTSVFTDLNYSPQCGEKGTLTITLPVGDYRVQAQNANNVWTSDISISSDQCHKDGIR